MVSYCKVVKPVHNQSAPTVLYHRTSFNCKYLTVANCCSNHKQLKLTVVLELLMTYSQLIEHIFTTGNNNAMPRLVVNIYVTWCYFQNLSIFIH